MVLAHCGRHGDRCINEMINDLEDSFAINNLQLKARAFCTACLLCCHINGGKIVPRSYGELHRSSERYEGLHMDYLYIRSQMQKVKYSRIMGTILYGAISSVSDLLLNNNSKLRYLRTQPCLFVCN
ncbi:Retrotransposon protein [Phytophthora megakarya]|uniref:Retrotransposon protein n=1 Tax=Phytophthora megakarya TaxID=4795 RepID=A0A225WQK9_9STRA|nr:Retrotransposon protein [Phytophthora megakarya]